ncbi:MAG: hypothetical protein KGS48_13265, partial [Bacteroidetes bacterium]|nr:hypothetical protein [Bacteroidota bacterium]
YDENMDLLSGAYKRKTQQLLLIFGLGIALVFNANTINIYKTLNQDDQKRAALADMATEMMQTKQLPRIVDTIKTSATADSVLKQIRAYENNLDSIQKKYAAASNVLGLGWDCDCEGNGNWKMSSKESFINYNALLGCPKEKDQVPAIREYFYVVLGWLITAIAISFGSPFWFDVLKSLINIRSAGKSPAEKKA